MKILYNGTDIAADVSVNYCVHEMFAEKTADMLVLRFNDPKGTWSKWNPATGDTLRLKEGAGDTGKMFLHSIKSENGLFTLRAMSMPESGATVRSKSWEGIRFLQLGNEFAANHGLTFQNYGCPDQVYKFLKQDNETDFALFSRLCMLEGCSMLIFDGKLLAYREQYIEAQTPAASLTIGQDGVFSYQDNRGSRYGSCTVESGKYSGTFKAPGEKNKAVFRPPFPVAVTSNAEAARFAKGLLRNANKYGRVGQFAKSLLTGYAAASMVTLKTDKASAWNGNVFIYKVRHDFVRNQSTLYFREPLEGY